MSLLSVNISGHNQPTSQFALIELAGLGVIITLCSEFGYQVGDAAELLKVQFSPHDTL